MIGFATSVSLSLSRGMATSAARYVLLLSAMCMRDSPTSCHL